MAADRALADGGGQRDRRHRRARSEDGGLPSGVGATGAECPWGRHPLSPSTPPTVLLGVRRTLGEMNQLLVLGWSTFLFPQGRCLCALPPPACSGDRDSNISYWEGRRVHATVSGPLWPGRWQWGGCACEAEGTWGFSVPPAPPAGNLASALKNGVYLTHKQSKPRLRDTLLTRAPEKPMTPSSPFKEMP